MFFVCVFRVFFERVFRGRKINGLLFKISGSDFKIRATNFFFAPMRGLRSENQFSIFGHGKRRFQTSVCLSEFLGRATGLLLEHPYEMLRILKAEHVGNLAYGLI